MDYSDRYQLVGEDKNHFELHDTTDKRKFKVAKKPLHPGTQLKIMRLRKYADGGEVGAEEPEVFSWGRMDDNKSEGEEDDIMDTLNSGLDAMGFSSPSATSKPMQALNYPNFNPLLPEQAPPPSMMEAPQMGGAPQAPVMDAPMGEQPQQEMAPQQPMQQGGGGYNPMSAMQGSSNLAKQGINEEATALQKQNDAMAGEYDQIIQKQQQDLEKFQAKMGEYQQQGEQIANDIASTKIDPNKYWNSRSEGQKTTALIGMLLSGFGAGASGQPGNNMALQMINKTIDRDILGQKEELGKKQTLLSDNFRKQGNLISAENATRLQMASIIQGKMAKIAAQTNNPIIAARAKQQIAAIDQQMMPYRIQLAQSEVKKQNISQALQGGHIGPLIDEVIQEPSMRKAAYEEIGKFKGIQNAMQMANGTIDEMVQNNSMAGWMTNPIQRNLRASQLEAKLFPIVKKIVGERMTDADARSLVKPYAIGLLGDTNTAKKAKTDFFEQLEGAAKEATPIISEKLGPYGIKFIPRRPQGSAREDRIKKFADKNPQQFQQMQNSVMRGQR